MVFNLIFSIVSPMFKNLQFLSMILLLLQIYWSIPSEIFHIFVTIIRNKDEIINKESGWVRFAGLYINTHQLINLLLVLLDKYRHFINYKGQKISLRFTNTLLKNLSS